METTAQEAERTAALVLKTVTELVQEMRSRVRAEKSIAFDSKLEHDLGLDSLGRAELVLRLERVFGVALAEQALLAETPRDLLREVLAASGRAVPAAVAERRYQAPEAVEETPVRAETLLEMLDWHLQAHPERICINLYGDGDRLQEQFSYHSLWQGARELAAGLIARELQPGERVAIMLPTERGYFFSFFGTLVAGGVPVPIYPPVRPSQIEEHLRRHAKILSNAQASLLITVPQAKAVARLLQAQVKELRQVVTVEELAKTQARSWVNPPVRAQDLAFLQYTSGSTGDPKGVMLTHANLLANLRVIGERIQARSTDVFVSWLPLYHDMGLIGAFLGTLYYAVPLVVMSPLSFLRRPASWLWAIHRHRATLSAAPNFAYELCLRNIEDSTIQGLDLSSWRMAFNGAEPVSPATVEAFIQRFSQWGFRAEAMAPVYGLAESSVGLTLQPPNRGLVIDRVQRDIFMSSGRAVPATESDGNVLRFVSCGQPLLGHQIRIVDESGRELPERVEGGLEFRGPSCTTGYFRNPEATRRLFHGDWLDSGDRAYVAEGDIYITGRVKDVVIRGGRNLYPYELEEAVGGIGGIRRGCVAVFASPDPTSGTERLVVVAETRETKPEVLENLRRRIQEISIDLLAMPVDEVVLAPPRTVLKTSSGKIRRSAVRDLYEGGTLGRGSQALWWQVARLALSSALPQVRRWLKRIGESLYAGYAWTVFTILAPCVWLAMVLSPRSAWCWAVARGAGRLLGWLTGTSLSVQGLDNLPAGPCVLVANHASYLDAYVLAAAIPRNFSYVAKRELAANFLIRFVLERMDTLFVERFDLQRSAEEGKRVAQAVGAGRSLAFFPEGTFDRMPGLLPFHMGAFVAAAQAGVPVVPVAIRGTRSILRAYSWFPRRGAVRVTVGTPLFPEGRDWAAALKLRDQARQAILRYSGEPDLGQGGQEA
jgi:1-acyl-sn-glycerol-3-phosphate acyltransferase